MIQRTEQVEQRRLSRAALACNRHGLTSTQLEVDPDVDALVMTAYASTETAVNALRHGVTDYLSKPFTKDEMSQLLERCLGVGGGAPTAPEISSSFSMGAAPSMEATSAIRPFS